MGIEINRILKLFADLQHGDCWIGESFKTVLHGINASMAAQAVKHNTNSIWQLVSHIIYWRCTVINRLTGSANPPPFADFRLPEILDQQSWKQTLSDFESTYHLLRSVLFHFREENLDKPSLRKEQTHYQLIVGCLQHDTYHLGQIMLLKKMLN